MKYKELDKVQDFKDKMVTPKQFIARYKPQFAIELTVVDIVGVPNIQTHSVEGPEGPHVEVRFFLFDQVRKVIKSNVQIAKAKIVKNDKPSSSWQLPDYSKSIMLRASENHQLIVELVSIDPKDKSQQLTVAWTSLDIN